MPDTAQALGTFKEMVTSVGGTFGPEITRPPAYQASPSTMSWTRWVKGFAAIGAPDAGRAEDAASANSDAINCSSAR